MKSTMTAISATLAIVFMASPYIARRPKPTLRNMKQTRVVEIRSSHSSACSRWEWMRRLARQVRLRKGAARTWNSLGWDTEFLYMNAVRLRL